MPKPGEIIALARAGRLKDALNAWKSLGGHQARNAEFLALGGNLYGRAGDLEQAGRCFKRALAADKRNLAARVGMAQTLRRRHELMGAIEHLRFAARTAPADLAIANHLALCLRDAGRIDEALRFLGPHARRTDHPGTRYNHANLLLAAGRHGQALERFRSLLEDDPGNPSFLNGLGMAAFGDGRLDTAIEAFEKALAADPDAPPALANLARAYQRAGRLAEAEDLLRRLLARRRDAYEPRVQLANLLREQQRTDEALERLQAAIGIDPKRPEAHRDRVAALEEANRLEAAEAALAEARAHHPADPGLELARARLLRRRGKVDEAIGTLAGLRPDEPELERRCQHELALAWDRAGAADSAWKHLAAFNRLSTAEPPKDPFLDGLLARIAKLPWPAGQAAAIAAETTPIFLVGFPRSGTTLLGRILGAHSRLRELEETPYIAALARSLDWPQGEVRDPQALRQRYLERVGDLDGQRLLDRNPLNLAYLPLIRELWPDAPVIFCQRHPGDVCLSCLFQDFQLNWLTRHFRDPADTVSACETLLGRWQAWRGGMDPAPLVIRYEELVANPQAAIGALCESLGIEFEVDMIAARRRAPASKTASYAQVAEPIHKGSVDRWSNYRGCFGTELADRLDRLAGDLGY